MSDGTAMHDLSAPRHTTLAVSTPGEFNHWAIPGAVLITVALCGVALWMLAVDRDPGVTTAELTVLIAAGVGTVSTVSVVREYLHHKAVACDHAAILAEVAALRELVEISAGAQVAMLEQISAKEDRMTELYWHDFVDDVSKNGGVVQFGRRSR